MCNRILAINTATEACSVALMLDDLLLERLIIAPHEHTKYILPMIDSLLIEANIQLKNLDALVFSSGPGSFMGIRIGIGIAQGLALGANIPIIGVSTLATLAEGTWSQTGACQVLTVIDARMGEIYWAPYYRKNNVWLGEDHEVITTPEALVKFSTELSGYWTTAGNGWQTYPTLLRNAKLELITGNTLLPQAKDMLPLAIHYYHNNGAKLVELAKPVYLRNKVVWK